MAEKRDGDIVQDGDATFEELAQIELDFEDIETIIMAKQYILSRPLYERRALVIQKIPNFWPLAFETSPPEIDTLIQPTDSEIIASSLTNFSVDRFEVTQDVDQRSSNVADYGTPRSLLFRFEFSENEWFEDKVLEKKFYWRRAQDGFVGLVSSPVKIHWKPGKDLTKGLIDAACALADAWEKRREGTQLSDLKEAVELEKRVDATTEGAQSFFAWFGYVGRFITVDESEAAWADFNDKRRTSKNSESKISMADMQLEGNIMESEIFPGGEALATDLADQFWPGALSYFTNAQEDQSEADFEEEDLEDEDDEGDEMDDVAPPPAKKQKM